MTIFNPPKFVTRSLMGAVGLSAIALLGVPEVAKASGADCGLFEGSVQGPDWVSNCPEGSDHFPNTWATIHFLVDDSNPFDIPEGLYYEVFEGPAWITREQGADGVIVTTIFEELISIPELGMGPDGAGLGFPIELIGNGTGAITDLDGDGFADSFFDVSPTLEIDGLGPDPIFLSTLPEDGPLTVFGDRPLIGVSPDVIIPPEFPITPGLDCTPTDPFDDGIAINYCGIDGAAPLQLFINDDPELPTGIFIVAETHTVHPHVPEPSTTLGLLFLGLGSVAGLKRRDKAKK
jgi:hypothetical protein